MGIPSYFRVLLEENNNIINIVKNPVVDYLFLDFNSIIYNVYNENQFINSEILINNIIDKIKIICNLVKPKKALYIAVDGTAPRSKIVQQRSRRYKSLQIDEYKAELKKKFNIKTSKNHFNPSNNACPGTKFMLDLDKKILEKSKSDFFGVPKVIYDNFLRPGEGEHKILPHIKRLSQTDYDSNVFIYSPDNDIISLSVLSKKNKISILRYLDPYSLSILRKTEYITNEQAKNLMMTIDIEKLKENFQLSLETLYDKSENINKYNILVDYNFLLSIVGNDFIPSLSYMKIKNGGLDTLIEIYKKIKEEEEFQNQYLISVNKDYQVNMLFFKEIIKNLAKMENSEMKKLHSFLLKERNKTIAVCTENDKEKKYNHALSIYEHCYIVNREHPLHNLYENDFNSIDLSKDKHIWKGQYYNFFTGVNPTDYSSYNNLRTKMVKNYLSSLIFTLYYYNESCPSYSWYYEYRVPPLFSDIYTILDKHHFDINTIQFSKGEPFTPFQQLCLILPRQSRNILPKEYQFIFNEYENYYPETFKIDAFMGLKYIYSEAILPESNCVEMLKKIQDIEKETKCKENTLSKKLYCFNF
tara:strand:- start:2699 stop:4453 length:1755 start_codon:yes stop_codon:yes gene_type:complete